MNAVDTNVLIYACDNRYLHKQAAALKLISDLPDGVILWQVACEFINASRKLAATGLTADEAWARLHEFMRVLPLVTPSPSALVKARELHVRLNLAFWDAMVIASALDCGVTRLYSEDIPGCSVPGIELINPF